MAWVRTTHAGTSMYSHTNTHTYTHTVTHTHDRDRGIDKDMITVRTDNQ